MGHEPGCPRVQTTEGMVEGRWRSQMAEFRGLPYARPPVGNLRFVSPAPPARWEGTREAIEFGPPPPQSGPVQTESVQQTEWLTLNVSTPDPGSAGLPVIVWIPGGAYITGVGSDPAYDATRLCRTGVVVVTINYRVGVEGFAHLEGAPANRGLLDQIAALEWVQRNIGWFGGDPSQVTVAGQSAGAGSIAALLAMSSARELFQQATAHSVPGSHITPALAEQVTSELAQRLGVSPTADAMGDVDPWRLADALTAFNGELAVDPARWGRLAQMGVAVCPVIDGQVLPEDPWSALHSGRADGIDLVVGHTRDEFRLFSVMAGRAGTFTDAETRAALDVWAPKPHGAADYRSAFCEAAASELLETVESDALFRMPSLHLAKANTAAGGTSYLFELCLTATALDGILGACHSLDVPLAFGTLDSPTGKGVFGAAPSPAARRVSQEIGEAWARFVAIGDPGWPVYRDEQRLTRVLDAMSATVPYPEEFSRQIWENSPPTPFDITG
ncbi:carboxylesterase/lipase family protein [Brevibacterium sp. UCMA 11754]|uniref:carboxylesterase/lipase family protein n=1 Tax=Brevibacterium sp. UCMA 11754 TaxID=2749198 RepID=UPI001F20D2CC|nr:carboxylesterase family protein [Brevibacterium sp. UCMA 11754]MCF2573068.1 carboxylesterase/lipase family protein [Brevibacterium sp. UCMA 11754]